MLILVIAIFLLAVFVVVLIYGLWWFATHVQDLVSVIPSIHPDPAPDYRAIADAYAKDIHQQNEFICSELGMCKMHLSEMVERTDPYMIKFHLGALHYHHLMLARAGWRFRTLHGVQYENSRT